MTLSPSASDRTTGSAPSGLAAKLSTKQGRIWGTVAVLAALVPVAGVFTLERVFYVRDLSLFFWDRHLWFRRSLFSGEWPLWDPYLAAGQSAAADALHQMFLLPVLAIRLIGTEVIGFNLWVALPFPLAALGAYLFFRSRFSPSAAALGAITFAASGPVVSTGNFPNMSWSVAALPWVLWAADRCEGPRVGRRIGVLALVFAFQAAAGEPVTMAATAALTLALSFFVGSTGTADDQRARTRASLAVASGLALGGLVAAVQLLPMASAVSESWRPFIRKKDFWSFHPLVLGEMVSSHLFGNYFDAPTFDAVPWLRALNGGREPFFYSVYVGPVVLALALFGLFAGWRRAWVGFWGAAGLIGLIAAFGGHTAIYPFVRTYLPLVGSFRFPVKYLVITVIALAALVAAAWDVITVEKRREIAPGRYRAAWYASVALPLVIGLCAYLLSGAALYFPTPAARWFYDIAIAVGAQNPVDAAAFMLRSVGDAMSRVVLLSLAVALFMAVAPSRRREARLARTALFGVLVVDLLNAAWGINPMCEVTLLRPPAWTQVVREHPDSRFYFGGKMAGTIEVADADAPKDFHFQPGLTPMEGRAAFVREIVMSPAGCGARELLSYDLAVLWPKVFESTHVRFVEAGLEERERFLSRAAVRYRVLPKGRGGDRAGMPVGAFVGVELYDWGPEHTRAYMVPSAQVVAGQAAQMDAMFGPSFDARRTVLTRLQPGAPDGAATTPVEPRARIVAETANRVLVEAGAGADGGFIVLLDSYSPDWTVVVDGKPGTIYPANLLFRAVRLTPGRHQVEFRYRPRAVMAGAALSLVGLMAVVGLMFWRRRTTRP